jgi:hypothetical protein
MPTIARTQQMMKEQLGQADDMVSILSYELFVTLY